MSYEFTERLLGLDAGSFAEMDTLDYGTTSLDGRDVDVGPTGGTVTMGNRTAYVHDVLQYRLHEMDMQATAVRRGLAEIVPAQLFVLFDGAQLERLAREAMAGDGSVRALVWSWGGGADERRHVVLSGRGGVVLIYSCSGSVGRYAACPRWTLRCSRR